MRYGFAHICTIFGLLSAITYIFSKPVQLLLDRLIPEQERQLHSRDELGMIVGEHRNLASELDEDEVEIIQGALAAQ